MEPIYNEVPAMEPTVKSAAAVSVVMIIVWILVSIYTIVSIFYYFKAVMNYVNNGQEIPGLFQLLIVGFIPIPGARIYAGVKSDTLVREFIFEKQK